MTVLALFGDLNRLRDIDLQLIENHLHLINSLVIVTIPGLTLKSTVNTLISTRSPKSLRDILAFCS